MVVMKRIYQAVVVGGGPAGLATALALAKSNVDVALTAPPHRPSYQSGGAGLDRRTAALFGGSVALLKNLGVWDQLAAVSQPLEAIRIVDDTGNLMRAPEVTFRASETGLDAFGYNVPNAALVDALRAQACEPASGVTVIDTAAVDRVEIGSDAATITTREGTTYSAQLIAAADGRNSICRQAAGIGTKSWSYPQTAVVCAFDHSRPHRNVSTEFHRNAGPFTTVPMPGQSSSLVWVATPDEAEHAMGLSDADITAIIEQRLQGLLGTISNVGRRAAFPLSGLTAETFAQNRVALIGEAGHVIPPIGAQGLNLGLRDAAALADCVADAASPSDVGASDVLRAYAAARATDVTSRVWGIDVLNRSLLSELAPVQLARGAGIYALSTLGPLRRLILREGIQPSNATPRLMQA
jgi:2-octaprenyl-6-methoxyphenol hydroxylase